MTPSSLHLVASALLAMSTVLLLVVLSRPALERRRDLRAWVEELNRRPVDLSAVVLRGRAAARSRELRAARHGSALPSTPPRSSPT